MSQSNNECEASDGNAKSLESALNGIAEIYVCPIMLELPLDPVKAMDGKTYERSAIEEVIERQGDDLRSPATNEPMEPKLLPDYQARSTIKQLVKTGTINGDKARLWEKRIKDEEHVASLKEKVEQGDSGAMYELGQIFRKGLHGQKQDDVKAYEWYKKAADQYYPPAMAATGGFLCFGTGVTENVAEGMLLLGIAAEKGCPVSAYLIGHCYAKGGLGMPKDTEKAKEWLQKAISGSDEYAWTLKESFKSEARDMLNNLLGESDTAAARSSA